MPHKSQHEAGMEGSLGLVLRTGVLVSCGVMLAGAVLYLLRHSAEHESFAAFHGEPSALESISGVIKEALAGTARGIIQLSVLILIATPVMRVIFAAIGFARERDLKFVAVSLTVLALLAYGLFEHH